MASPKKESAVTSRRTIQTTRGRVAPRTIRVKSDGARDNARPERETPSSPTGEIADPHPTVLVVKRAIGVVAVVGVSYPRKVRSGAVRSAWQNRQERAC